MPNARRFVSGVGTVILLAGALDALAAEWQPGVAYSVGVIVTYQGPSYECLQAHTSQVGWEPPNTPALWQATSGTPTATPTATPTSQTVTPTASPSSTPAATPTATASPTSSGGSTVNVATASQLSAALGNAQPGQTIALAAGTYVGNFKLLRSGASSARITISGPSGAILQGTSVGGGYALHLDHSSYVTVRGITLTNAQKGIIADGVMGCLIDAVNVHDVGMEAIHLRSFSSNNIVQSSRIWNTGRSGAGFGEGLYVGSANSNWGTYSGGAPDASNNNKLIGNTLGPGITAECIDIKEGTAGGEIRGNRFDSTGISGANYADSWVDVKGNNWVISNNTGYNPSGSLLLDGLQVHAVLAGWGNNNQFSSNDLTVNAAGYGFNVQSTSSGNVVYSTNVVRGAAKGTANVPLQ